MLLKAILITIVAWLLSLEYMNGHFGFSRPLVAATIIGTLLGDIKTGIIVGSSLQLIFMGISGVGAAVPPDAIIGTVIATAFSILAHQNVEVSLSLAVPVAVASQALDIFARTATTGLMHMADKAAEEERYNKLELAHYLGGLVIFVRVAIIVFPAIYFGVGVVENLISVIPASILKGLEVAGGMLPAVGFGMLLTMLDIKKLKPFYFIGFALATFGNFSLIGVTMLSCCIALLFDYFARDQKSPNIVKKSSKDAVNNLDELMNN